MNDLSIAAMLALASPFLMALGAVLFVVGQKRELVSRLSAIVFGSGVVSLFAGLTMAAFFPVDSLSFPYSTYIEDGVTMVEGDKVVEKLPDKFQEAIARMRFGQNAYTLQEASVKNKLKGDGIQQDHTVVWLTRPEETGMFGSKKRFVFVGLSHDVLAKSERLLKVELSGEQLHEMMDHFPAEFRDPVLSTFASGGYKAYGLGPVSYGTLSSMSEVCGIQLIKEKLMPVDIANQRQRVIVDEVDVFVEDRTITVNTMLMHP